MKCPKCGMEMKSEDVMKGKGIGFPGSIILEYCSGRFLKWHGLLQYSSLDNTFNTKDTSLANWFRGQGWYVTRQRTIWSISR